MNFQTVSKFVDAFSKKRADERRRAKPKAGAPPTDKTHYDGKAATREGDGPAPLFLGQMLISHMRSLIQGMSAK